MCMTRKNRTDVMVRFLYRKTKSGLQNRVWVFWEMRERTRIGEDSIKHDKSRVLFE
jgi:hypothetical protein